jgi:hypothetical protein
MSAPSSCFCLIESSRSPMDPLWSNKFLGRRTHPSKKPSLIHTTPGGAKALDVDLSYRSAFVVDFFPFFSFWLYQRHTLVCVSVSSIRPISFSLECVVDISSSSSRWAAYNSVDRENNNQTWVPYEKQFQVFRGFKDTSKLIDDTVNDLDNQPDILFYQVKEIFLVVSSGFPPHPTQPLARPIAL